MQPSANLISFLKQTEGFRASAYLDPPRNTRGLHSIGYGHQIRLNEPQLLTKVLTQQEATLMLDADLRYYVDETNRALKRPVTQSQFDALVDVAYNAGVGAMQHVAATWNKNGNVADTVARLKLYIHANGVVNEDLVARRAHEANWFQFGVLMQIVSVQKKNS